MTLEAPWRVEHIELAGPIPRLSVNEREGGVHAVFWYHDIPVGISSFLVAILGVVTPFALGWGVGYIFLPDSSWLVHMFIGATLTATSVGITARVLKDLNKIQARAKE